MQNKIPCPNCGIQGHRIDSVTSTAMLGGAARAPLATIPLRFCASERCDVVYYGDGNPALVRTGDLAVQVFQKCTDPSRLVCYCFDHTVESLEREVATTGVSEVPELIARKCKAGLDDCKRNNPQGRCCLVNVRNVVRAAQALRGSVPERDAAASSGCCSSLKASDVPAVRSESSTCCASTTTPESE